MAWIKVPPENRPLFQEALPKAPRVETLQMFGGIVAKVNGHIFAGLFGRSTMVRLSEADRKAALALEGAAPFDPMGDGRARSDKIMLPEAMMTTPPSFAAGSREPSRPGRSCHPNRRSPQRSAPPGNDDGSISTWRKHGSESGVRKRPTASFNSFSSE
jgi:hypothetical protein